MLTKIENSALSTQKNSVVSSDNKNTGKIDRNNGFGTLEINQKAIEI